VKRAKKEKAEIHWSDETGVSNQANYGRSFAPVGATPVVRRPAKRFTQSMISSLTNRGELRFMMYDGALNAAIFLKFLRRLIRGAARKMFVIVDNLRVHKARAVKAWVEENADRIELFYLPPYAPERNPDEYANNDVKQAMGWRSTPMDKAAMKASLTSHMRGLQRRPAKVTAFFQAPDVRYAA
jgi:DDE superfamily endonuclease